MLQEESGGSLHCFAQYEHTSWVVLSLVCYSWVLLQLVGVDLRARRICPVK